MATTLTAYLSFDGKAREAFQFYEQALGAKIGAMMTYDDMPKQEASTSEGCVDGHGPSGTGIMHASLTLPGGAMLFGGDAPPGMPYQKITGVMLALQYESVDEAERAFAALCAGGNVVMPMAPTFWAKTFGMVNDQYGVSWGVGGGPLMPAP